MGNYLDVIEECVNNMSPSDVRTHNKNLLALSCLLLSYRSQRSQNDVCSLGGGGGGYLSIYERLYVYQHVMVINV